MQIIISSTFDLIRNRSFNFTFNREIVLDADTALSTFYSSVKPRLTVERLIDFRTLQERKALKAKTTPRERRKSRHRLSVSRRGQLEHLRNKVFFHLSSLWSISPKTFWTK